MTLLKQKRLDAGLTLEQVSELTKIHISTLSRLENGIYSLRVDRLDLLAKALGCKTTDLIPHTNGHLEAPHA